MLKVIIKDVDGIDCVVTLEEIEKVINEIKETEKVVITESPSELNKSQDTLWQYPHYMWGD